MAKKKDEKDVLIVRDEKTGEISVVAGLNADGSPKRTPAKAENAQSFLQFDRHGDVLDNFFKNFFRQCKEPSRFGFYRVAADQADKLLEVIKDLLKDPDGNKEMLAPHKVDTSGYEKKVQEEQAAEKPEQKQEEPKKQEEMEQKNEQNQESPQQTQGNRGYQPIDESKINWQELEEKWGVKRDDLEKSGDLTKMLNYGKSDLVRVSPNFGGEAFELDARLSFKKDSEGNVSLVPHFIRKEQKLDEYKEHKFSDEDRKNLRETGNLGRVVDIVDRETGEIIPSFISIDRKTNEITDIPANKVRIPERIGKTEITKQEQDMLRAGLPVRDKLIERKDGRKFVTTLQVNVEQRGVEFVPGTGRSPRAAQAQEAKNNPIQGQAQDAENAAAIQNGQRRNSWTNADGSIRPISKWSGVEFTEQQKADYVAGKAVKLENVTDKQGFHATMYIRFNPEKGRPYRYDTDPDNAQKVAPSNESRTQVAVNSEGKTNEATKNLKEPLRKGQTAPKDTAQQQQQENGKKRNKGMRM
ncbi:MULTISPECIES: DUF4099 domain-containing protein [Bacteroidales]|uniref:DUF4099 domain-containing protein n=3 Tax=Bacteroidales TaxID=171549 RepID=A0A1C7GWU0_9BACE|nr:MULTISPECIES: DUF4099 domain-containing protein [Bacteroidales]NPE38870.1 DUF4099 domain-containing protein [Prevotella sp. PCJ2]ANU56825.1 hypothetical protein A4V03_03905 [Bacteroides caecimuris]OXE66787.1 hypothetical protein ADH74_04420 [Bacteroides caecimuris]QQR18322.1 DUF4099 domain-containing protein [Bacteroides caecimuris]RLT79186.1 DUF4099 domain-containing protein [Bacteroides acidifaciens]